MRIRSSGYVSVLLCALVATRSTAGNLLRSNATLSNHPAHTHDEDEEHEDHILTQKIERYLMQPVDPLVVQRYKQVPEGFRKHPSYYSETYLTRSQPYTPDQWDALATEWGKWTLVDSKAPRPVKNDFYDQFPNRDVPMDKFPDTAWQKDTDYLAQFLNEATALTERAMEAILSEYGLGKKDMPGKALEERHEKFMLVVGGPHQSTNENGGWMTEQSFQGLQRRILHSIMAQDRFTVAMGGHSAAAGHGNHFIQTYTIGIARILEPIFARLGVKMSSRNFGMGGLGTLQNSMAAGDIYGRDVDVLLWDSSMTEKEASARAFFAVQALFGIDRAPLMWMQRDNDKILDKISNLTGADFATYGFQTAGGFPTVQTAEELEKLPWALRFHSCPKKELGTYCNSLRYVGKCWQNRSNFIWEGMDLSYDPEGRRKDEPGGRAGWHPGNREHQLMARGFTFSILQALMAALKQWKEKPNYALADSDWHVTEYYKSIKAKLYEHREEWYPFCDDKKISRKFCSYAAQGRTEYTPRNRPWETSLRSIMAGSEHPNMNLGKNEYDPPDVFNPSLFPPEGEIDVLAIVENGISFPKNLARVKDSAQDMQGAIFTTEGKGSKHDVAIKGGKGWNFESPEENAGTDNCDGEHDSWCRRSGDCLMYAHNDARTGLIHDGFSGWFVFNLPKVEHGLITVKFHCWTFTPPTATQGWCSENNETPCKERELSLPSNSLEDQRVRELKPPVPKFCDDFKLEFAINGKITSWNREQVEEKKLVPQRVVELFTLLDDDSWEGPKDVELALRITGCGRQKPFSLTHLYWM